MTNAEEEFNKFNPNPEKTKNTSKAFGFVGLGIFLICLGLFISKNNLFIKDETPKIITLQKYEAGYLPETNRIFLLNRKTNEVEYILSDTVFSLVATKVQKDYNETIGDKKEKKK